MTDTTYPDAPPKWASLVDYHTRRIVSEGVERQAAAAQARTYVDQFFQDEAWKTNDLVGPWHFRHGLWTICGRTTKDAVGARIATGDITMVTCPECQIEVDRRLVRGGELAAANPAQATAAAQRVAERYLVDVLGVPDWATPAGTVGTPVHALACEVRAMAQRRMRLLYRFGRAAQAMEGQALRIRFAVDDGRTPTVGLSEPDDAFAALAAGEAVRELDLMLAKMSATLTLTCSQVNRALKAEQLAAAADPGAVQQVLDAASDWRDLVDLNGRSGRTRAWNESVQRLNDAVDAYRAPVRPETQA